jgi:hypothetical protein
MTFIEAAIEILRQNGNQPMSSSEIWNKISEQNLVNTSGKTPWASLNTILIYHSRPEYKKTLYFNIVSNKPLKFTILDLNVIHLGVEVEPMDEGDISIRDSWEWTPITSSGLELILENISGDSEKIPLYSITSKELGWKKLTVYNNNETIEYELSDCPEYTYIIEDRAHATIKIGKTKNDPEIRFNQLKTANPSINLLHVFPSDQWSESELHEKFGDVRKDLEWFFFTIGLRKFISDEMNKHGRVLLTWEKNRELLELEKMMLDIL